jgi:hypothetical protein
MICALGVSHRDLDRAKQWLEWVAVLESREVLLHDRVPLIIMCTQTLNSYQVQLLREATGRFTGPVDIALMPDTEETGYPKSASHLFLRTMEYCETRYPDDPVLWVEADTVPMRPGWREAIATEYLQCNKPFLGVIERGHGFAHLAGVAVYPPDWRQRAPLLADVINAGDVFWGPKLGQAFDTYAAPQTVPQAAEARSIQQIWRPHLPLTSEWMDKNIRPDVQLFHQCKDQSAINILRGKL